MKLYESLCGILGKENVWCGELMSRHTTFRVGGPADYFVTPDSEERLQGLLELLREDGTPYYVVGNGSNLLVGDKGYRGVVVQIGRRMNRIHVAGNTIEAQAGVPLSRLAAQALEEGLKGLEFASGIPGTLGGAVMMNAGAYGGEMKQVLQSARVLTTEGKIETRTVEEMKLGYRTSIFADNGDIILSALIRLETGEREQIRARMEELKTQRMTKQPLEYPSAGSTFKRPEGYFAGKLIEDAGLRGFQVGGAQISEKHCGFVINREQATATDIRSLMERVADKVEETSGVRLEPEVRQIGEF